MICYYFLLLIIFVQYISVAQHIIADYLFLCLLSSKVIIIIISRELRADFRDAACALVVKQSPL